MFILGYQVNVITSESMEPTIMTGNKYLIKKVKFKSLKVGDIISFTINGHYITHRIIGLTTEGIKTKGDNKIKNKLVDPWTVKEKDFIGKVVKIWK